MFGEVAKRKKRGNEREQNRYNFEISVDSMTMLGSKSDNFRKNETQEVKDGAKDDLPF